MLRTFVRALLGCALILPAAAVAPSAVAATQPATTGQSVTATCYASTCAGKDPQATGCSSGAYTVTEFTTSFGGIRVELRSSPCYAYWTRAAAYPPGYKIVISTYGTVYYAYYNPCPPNCQGSV